jgi:hypothetical protein
MLNKAVRGIAVLGLVAVTAAAGLGMFIQNSTGDFNELLVLGESGVMIFGFAFIPLSLFLLLKAALS